MRVCHVITRLILGGAQENTLLTCEGLHARGHEVTLITGDTAGEDGQMLRRALAGGYRVVVCPALRRAVSPLAEARALAHLTSLLRRLQPDVAHTHSSKAGVLGRWAAWRVGTRAIVHTVHGMSFNRTQPAAIRAAYRWLERGLAPRTHALVGVCDAMRDQCLAAGVGTPAQHHVIRSGMELAPWLDARRTHRARVREGWGLSPNGAGLGVCVVGVAARLFPAKGHADVIELLSCLQASGRLSPPFSPRRPQLRFVWAGDGSLRPWAEAELARRGLGGHVRLLGLVPPAHMPAVMSGFDVLVHASRWEGLPRVLPQAMLTGLPTLAWQLDGNPEACQDGTTGYCLPTGDVEGMAHALDALAGHPDLRQRLGEAGRRWAQAEYDVDHMVSQLDALYARLLAAQAR